MKMCEQSTSSFNVLIKSSHTEACRSSHMEAGRMAVDLHSRV